MKTPEELAEEYVENHAYSDECEFARETYLAGYEAATPKWVCVKDKLPSIGAFCIWIDTKLVTPSGIGSRDIDDVRSWWENYTHWMPLPTAPKEEK
jgi:hypothetical protein